MSHPVAKSVPLGKRGEDYARRRLERQGWNFVGTNWHCQAGELDLIMRDGNELVFVEVKTRRGDFSGRAEESISPRKAQRLLVAAEWFISEHPDVDGLVWRIDLIAITVTNMNEVVRYAHVPNAVLVG